MVTRGYSITKPDAEKTNMGCSDVLILIVLAIYSYTAKISSKELSSLYSTKPTMLGPF